MWFCTGTSLAVVVVLLLLRVAGDVQAHRYKGRITSAAAAATAFKSSEPHRHQIIADDHQWVRYKVRPSTSI